MPELPEVESFARTLTESYHNARIERVIFRRDDIRRPLSKQKLRAILKKGATVRRIWRDGKRLVIETTEGAINISLGMSGSFIASDLRHPLKHEHITIAFQNAPALGYVDSRRFGSWDVRTTPLTHLADPLEHKSLLRLFSSNKFNAGKRSVKDVLMDQRAVGGLGNIYVLEALHQAGIAPTRKTSTLIATEKSKLATIIPKILAHAIRAGGSTVRTYRRLHGDKGGFQSLHRVYDREGEKCLKKDCGGTVKKIRQGGRGSWFCPDCQS